MRAGLMTRYKPRMRQLRTGAWWCTWYDGSVGFGWTQLTAYAMAKDNYEAAERRSRMRATGRW